MAEAKLFISNKSQAVRLPKPVAFPPGVERVEVIELGRSRLLTPAGARWDDFFESPAASPDFMTERDQPAAQEREGF
ncbi:MAG: putative plasmid protein [Moraxellaceae bacterium]|jgi:antitoxin VapB|nr:putative plasmid protein [Moraxellaceae bacterium]